MQPPTQRYRSVSQAMPRVVTCEVMDAVAAAGDAAAPASAAGAPAEALGQETLAASSAAVAPVEAWVQRGAATSAAGAPAGHQASAAAGALAEPLPSQSVDVWLPSGAASSTVGAPAKAGLASASGPPAGRAASSAAGAPAESSANVEPVEAGLPRSAVSSAAGAPAGVLAGATSAAGVPMTLGASVGPRAFYDHGLGFCDPSDRARLAYAERQLKLAVGEEQARLQRMFPPLPANLVAQVWALWEFDMFLQTPNMFALVTVSASVFRLALRTDPSNLPGSFEWPGREAVLAQRGGEDEGA